jgi:hypothetical protein
MNTAELSVQASRLLFLLKQARIGDKEWEVNLDACLTRIFELRHAKANQETGTRTSHRCPVCLGSKAVLSTLYQFGNAASSISSVPCRSCDGSGVIWEPPQAINVTGRQGIGINKYGDSGYQTGREARAVVVMTKQERRVALAKMYEEDCPLDSPDFIECSREFQALLWELRERIIRDVEKVTEG